MVRLNNKTSIEYLESAYKLLSNKDPIDIQVTKSLSGSDFGLTPAIIQFIATWHSTKQDGKIVLNILIDDYTGLSELELKKLSNNVLSDFYKLDFFFPVMVYCWKRQIVDENNRDLKALLKIQNELKHEDMRKQTAGGGFKTLLSCFDHLSTKKGLLPSFYIDNDFIENEMQFDSALDKSLRRVISLNKHLRKSIMIPILSDIVGIIYELMKNTDDWARTDLVNRPLKPNVRGLFLKIHRRTRDSFISGFQNNLGLKNYFSEDNFKTNSNNELYFLELSVFDTGIGFVNRYSKLPTDMFDASSQVEIVKQCLIVNNTSSIGIQKSHKGKGLARIMNILNGKGYFWLRTGNVSIYRNLILNKGVSDAVTADIDLYDWVENSKSEFTHMETAKGSVVTLVYPFIDLAHV